MASRFVLQPFALRDRQGAVAVTSDPDRHLRDKILAVLFTAPGERVNEPRFGVGLSRHTFERLDDLTAAALEFRISEGLRRELGSEVDLLGVDVGADPAGGELLVSVAYARRSDRARRTLEIAL
ncbi:MAG: GPW/gp25 family protein [Kineosporiaceae bacterium]